MLAKRIIPCLDVKDGKTVKGVNFVNFRDAGDPVELGRQYSLQGADELVYLDITASFEGRKTFLELVKRVAAQVNIPFTVGGGINALDDVDKLLNAGADKVSINSSAIKNPELITQIANHFGNQVCVLAIDANFENDKWRCYLNGGRVATDKYLFDWAKEGQERGAGEILFTSMSHDGVKTGYANEALLHLHQKINIPVIASGGAGKKEHFKDVFETGKADAALAASVFHFGEIPIKELKDYLAEQGICVRK
ncbi:MAG: imidazole glycerol phosphate synthase subunit HisF [Bacteroidales bacterium]|nr:imidazole glycerol phosphate synthase subunit HisF [Bacteroidales bacterium]